MSDRKKFGFMITTELSQDQLLAKHVELEQTRREVLTIMAAKAVAMADFAQQIREKNKVEQRLLDTLGTKTEKIEIDCYQERDDRRGMMMTMRFDNNEIVDERALTVDELNDGKQKELPFKEKAAPDAPPPDPDAEPAEDADLAGKLAEYEALGDDAPPVPELEDEDDEED